MSDNSPNVEQQPEELTQQLLESDMESQYVALRSERDNLRTANSEQTTLIQQLQSQIAKLNNDINVKENESQDAKRSEREEKAKREEASLAAQTEKDKYTKLFGEMDELREEMSRLKESHVALKEENATLQSQYNHESSAMIPLKYEAERLQKELDSLKYHNKWLEEELNSRNAEVESTKLESSELNRNLKAELNNVLLERDGLKGKVTSLTGEKGKLESELDRLSKDLREKARESADALVAAEEEVMAERRMVSLYKEKCDEMESSLSERSREVEGFRDMVKEISEERDTAKEELKEAKIVLEEAGKDFEKDLKQLENKLNTSEEARKNAEKDLKLGRMARAQSTAIVPVEGGSAAQDNDDMPISLTELYDRLAATEDALANEKTERRRVELYLRKIQVEIEGKASVLHQQSKEYERALRLRDNAQERLAQALSETKFARTEMENMREDVEEFKRENKELRSENRDLATQVQNLLKEKIVPENDDPSNDDQAEKLDDLVTFTSVQELQAQNQRLLREYRTLKDAKTSLEKQLDESSIQMSLTKTQDELNSLREERERQTKLVAGVVQQRDLYRALLHQSDSDQHNTPEISQALVLKDKSTEIRTLSNEVVTLKSDLLVSRNENASLNERCDRLDAHSIQLSTSVDSLQRQLSAANATIARSDADASYHRDKCIRLDRSLENLQNEIAQVNKSAKEMKELNAKLQTLLSQSEVKGGRWEKEVKNLEVKIRLSESQLQVVKASEERLINENKSLREDLSRQHSFLSSIQKIEASLEAKAMEDKTCLKEEIEGLKGQLEREKTNHKTDIENWEAKVINYDMTMDVVKKERDEAKEECLGLKNEITALNSKNNEVEQKMTAIENELSLAKEQLGEYGEDDKQRIATLTKELRDSRTEVRTIKKRIVDYQKLAKDSENELVALTKASNDFKSQKNEDTEKMQKVIDGYKKDIEMKQSLLKEWGDDLGKMKGEREEVEKKLKAEIGDLRGKLESAEENEKALNNRVEELNKDLKKYLEAAESAQKNYDRELALHASARTELREAKSNSEEEKRLRSAAEDQLQLQRAEFASQNSELKEDKIKLQSEIDLIRNRCEQSQKENNLLLSQMETLTKSVEKVKESRDVNIREDDEISTMKKNVSELREIVGFMKSEREMLEAQLESAKRMSERERTTAVITKRSLDEARAELSILQEKTKVVEKESLEKKDEDGMKQQVLLLTESNALLREEGERITKKLAACEKKIDEMKREMEPKESHIRQLEVDKVALQSEKESLGREVEAWKNRVQSLISKFHQIDPEEHTAIKTRAENLQKELENVQSEMAKSKQELTSTKSLIARQNAQIAQHKTQLDAVTKKLSKVTAERDQQDELAKKSKESEDLKSKFSKMETELEASKTELKSTKGRVEHLTGILRRYKSYIDDLKKKQIETQDALKEKEGELKEKTDEMQQMKEEQESSTNQKTVEEKSETQQESSSAPVGSSDRITPPPRKKIATSSSNVTTQATTVVEKEQRQTIKLPEGGFKYGPSKKDLTKTDGKSLSTAATPTTETSSEPISEVPPNTPTTAAPLSPKPPTKSQSQKEPSTPPPIPLNEKKSDIKTFENTLRAKLLSRKRKLEQEKVKLEEKNVAAAAKAANTPTITPSQSEDIVVDKEAELSKDAKGVKDDASSKNLSPASKPAFNLFTQKDDTKAKDEKPQINPFIKSTFGSSTTQASAFLNLAPPTASAPGTTKLTFGSNPSIKLPMPSKQMFAAQPTVPGFSIFGSSDSKFGSTPSKTGFGNAAGGFGTAVPGGFGAATSTSLFGTGKKEEGGNKEKTEEGEEI